MESQIWALNLLMTSELCNAFQWSTHAFIPLIHSDTEGTESFVQCLILQFLATESATPLSLL